MTCGCHDVLVFGHRWPCREGTEWQRARDERLAWQRIASPLAWRGSQPGRGRADPAGAQPLGQHVADGGANDCPQGKGSTTRRPEV